MLGRTRIYVAWLEQPEEEGSMGLQRVREK
jgi:hypothetical protein